MELIAIISVGVALAGLILSPFLPPYTIPAQAGIYLIHSCFRRSGCNLV